MNYDIEFLKKNPVFFSRLGFAYDPPMKDENGDIVVFTKDYRKYAKFNDAFSKAGVKVHTGILHSGWVGADEYDYSVTDKTLDAFFENNSDCVFIPRVKLNVPIDWCKKNPEDVFVYYEGVEQRDKIEDLVATLRQDYLGYESETGYYRAGDEFADNRPNINSLIALQSFSSKKWLCDAAAALTKLIEHVEKRYPGKIAGYHIAYGACGESMLWGRQSEHYGDYGINNLRYFYDFAKEKYGSNEKIKEAWQINSISRDEMFLTSPEVRYFEKHGLDKFFRAKNQMAIDYDEFSSKTNSDAIIHFCKTVKQLTGKLAGVFYGYMNFMWNANYTGHLGVDRVLNSKWVDFFASPKSYYRCLPGDSGGFMCPVDSIMRKKIWLDELDNRTYLCRETSADENRADTPEGTNAVFLRELCKNMSHGASFWWMDLGGGWFDSPEIMSLVKKMTKIKKALDKTNHESTADVLVLFDEKGMEKTMPDEKFMIDISLNFMCELNQSGVLCDMYRLSDFTEIDTSGYKLCIFAHCFTADDKIKEKAEEINKNGCTLMYLYASGIWYNGKYDIDNVRKFTGFSVCPEKNSNLTYPPIYAIKGEKSGKTLKSGTKIIDTSLKLTSKDLNLIAKDAGCHIYGSPGSVYFGDNRFTAVFSGKGENILHLKEKGNYKDIVSGKTYENTDCINLDLNRDSAVIIVKEN